MLLPAHGESKGKIGVFIEDHFDMTEYRLFNKRFPAAGFDLEYITNLWGNPTLQFGSNPDNGWVEEHITVSKDVKDVNPGDYKGFLLIGAYATPGVKIGTICHSLWLLCADRTLLEGRKVTCAHNIICDVENAGADVQYGDDGTVGSVVDGDLITAKHPAFTDELIDLFIKGIEEA